MTTFGASTPTPPLPEDDPSGDDDEARHFAVVQLQRPDGETFGLVLVAETDEERAAGESPQARAAREARLRAAAEGVARRAPRVERLIAPGGPVDHLAPTLRPDLAKAFAARSWRRRLTKAAAVALGRQALQEYSALVNRVPRAELERGLREAAAAPQEPGARRPYHLQLCAGRVTFVRESLDARPVLRRLERWTAETFDATPDGWAADALAAWVLRQATDRVVGAAEEALRGAPLEGDEAALRRAFDRLAGAAGQGIATAADTVAADLPGVLAHQTGVRLNLTGLRTLPPTWASVVAAERLLGWRAAAGQTLPPGPRPTALPAVLPQPTFPEVRTLGTGLAAGGGDRWKATDGDIGAQFREYAAAPLGLHIEGEPLLSWLGLPVSVEALTGELAQAGIPAVLLLFVLLSAAIERMQAGGSWVTTPIDDLIGAIGWAPHTLDEREEQRRLVWRWMALLDATRVVGLRRGKWHDPLTGKKLDVGSTDALLRIAGRRDPAGLAFATSLTGGPPPLEVTYAGGPWLEKWCTNPRLMSRFGDIRRLAAIPAGKPSGAWAQVIGLALQQGWRERLKDADADDLGQTLRRSRNGHLGRFTRRELLNRFPPEPTVDDVLEGPHPRRAITYWEGAVSTLLEHDEDRHGGGRRPLIASYRSLGEVDTKARDWQDAWLDQEVEMLPADDLGEQAARMAERARLHEEAEERRRRRGGRPRKGVRPEDGG